MSSIPTQAPDTTRLLAVLFTQSAWLGHESEVVTSGRDEATVGERLWPYLL